MDLFKNRRGALLIGSVISVHLFLFFFDFRNKKHSPTPTTSIVVHTFVPLPSPKPNITSCTEMPASSKKIEKPKLPTTSDENESSKASNDSLRTLEPPPISGQKDLLTFPKNIQFLQIDQIDAPETSDYFSLLAQTLKEELEFPEHGDVKLELTVNHNGRVLKIRMVQATSEKNQKYLEINLPKMMLPPFNEALKNEQEHTFTLTFCNET